jgi:hypothetical protein
VACEELGPAFKGVFSSVVRVAATPPPGETQVVLLPRLVDARAESFGETVVVLEWTVKDALGRTLWIGTGQGSGNYSHGPTVHPVQKMMKTLHDALRDAAKQSAAQMSSAPELRKLTQ